MRNYFRLLAEGRENGTLSKVMLPLLEAGSWVYAGVNKTTRSLYENKVLPRTKLAFPVVSVGNLTWGGTGKTPLVEYLARRISEQHLTPLVLSRGYNRDEVEQLKHHLPRVMVGAGKDRARVAKEIAQKTKIDIAILDDGFQHWPLERNIEILVINSLNPFGNGKLIPRGILREPLHMMERAHIIVLSHSNLIKPEDLEKLKTDIRKLSPKVFLAEASLEPLFFYRAEKRQRVSLDRLQNKKVTTFSGVGTPRSFQLLLSRFQIKPMRNFEFEDHHEFTESELQEVKRISESASTDEIITTEKDYYRCSEKIGKVLNPLIMATRLRINSGEHAMMEKIFRLMSVKPA